MAREEKSVDPKLTPEEIIDAARKFSAGGGNERIVGALLGDAQRRSGLTDQDFDDLQSKVLGGDGNLDYRTPGTRRVLAAASVINGRVSDE